MSRLIVALFLLSVVIAEKERVSEEHIDKIADKLVRVLEKRLNEWGLDENDGLSDNDDGCAFTYNNGSIIRTQDSINAGAKFLKAPEVSARESCEEICCDIGNCNLAVYKDKVGETSCYLFDCRSPSVCLFTDHPGFVVMEIPQRQSASHRHEADLESLAAPTTAATTTTTTTEPTTTTERSTTHKATTTTEPPRAHHQPVPLFGECESHKDCAGSATECLAGYCVCQEGYHAQEGACRKECSRFEFECQNSGSPLAYPQCIAIYDKCDGIVHCKDGSDEQNCDDGAAAGATPAPGQPAGVNQQAQQPQPQAPNNYPMPLQNPQYPPQAPRYPPQPNYPPQANGAIQQGFRGQPQQPVIPAQQDPRTGQVPPQPGQPGQVRGQAPGQVRGQVPVHQQPPQERPLDRKHRPLDMSDNRPDDSPQTRPKVSKQNPVKTATHTVTTTTKVPPKHTTTTAQTVETRPQQQQPYWNRQFPDSDSATDDAYYTGGGGGGAYVPGYNRNYDNAGSYTGRQQNKGIYNSGGRLYSGGRDRGYFSNLYNTGGGYGAGVVDYDPYYLDSQGQVPAAAPNVPGAAYPNSDYDYYSDNGPGYGSYFGYGSQIRKPSYTPWKDRYPETKITWRDEDKPDKVEDNKAQASGKTGSMHPKVTNNQQKAAKTNQTTYSSPQAGTSPSVSSKQQSSSADSSSSKSQSSESSSEEESDESKPLKTSTPAESEPPAQSEPADEESESKDENTDTDTAQQETEAKSDINIASGLVDSEEEGEDDSEEAAYVGKSTMQQNQSAIVALSLGLVLTFLLLLFVGCRLRNMKRRLRKGRPLNSNEADYLINGMYL